MAKVYRAYYLRYLRTAWEAGTLNLPPGMPTTGAAREVWFRRRYRQGWVVYDKAPFRGSEAVVEYLGRYTHKVAISNHRVQDITERDVTFTYKDYRKDGKRKGMTLSGGEFLPRFCLHILPPGFRRLRHYGILSNALKTRALAAARSALGVCNPSPKREAKEVHAELLAEWLGRKPDTCGDCGAVDTLIRILLPPNSRAPPSAVHRSLQ